MCKTSEQDKCKTRTTQYISELNSFSSLKGQLKDSSENILLQKVLKRSDNFSKEFSQTRRKQKVNEKPLFNFN